MMSGSCVVKLGRLCRSGRRATRGWCRGLLVGASRTRTRVALGRPRSTKQLKRPRAPLAQKEYMEHAAAGLSTGGRRARAARPADEDYERARAEHADDRRRPSGTWCASSSATGALRTRSARRWRPRASMLKC